MARRCHDSGQELLPAILPSAPVEELSHVLQSEARWRLGICLHSSGTMSLMSDSRRHRQHAYCKRHTLVSTVASLQSGTEFIAANGVGVRLPVGLLQTPHVARWCACRGRRSTRTGRRRSGATAPTPPWWLTRLSTPLVRPLSSLRATWHVGHDARKAQARKRYCCWNRDTPCLHQQCSARGLSTSAL